MDSLNYYNKMVLLTQVENPRKFGGFAIYNIKL